MKSDKTKRIVAPLGMSHAAKEIALEQVALRLYRWYVDTSQRLRNWSPYRSFDLSAICHNHPADVTNIIRGFYAVEQYVPDYTSKITQLIRKSYGREHFQVRWGSEEDKHSELWRLALLFSKRMSEKELTVYTDELRAEEWSLPWDDPLHMLMYTVVQERATEMSYLNFRTYLRGTDPVLSNMCKVIAADETNHRNFFLRLAAAYLYFMPAEAGLALCDVINHFAMPASNLIPNYQAFGKLLDENNIYTRRTVAELRHKVLEDVGIGKIKTFEQGIVESRKAPDQDGVLRSGAFLNGSFNVQKVVNLVASMVSQVSAFEDEVSISKVDPLSRYIFIDYA